MGKLLLTGGTGYIATHTAVECLKAGHQLVLLDNLSNSQATMVERLEQIAHSRVPFRQLDLLDRDGLHALFDEEGPFDGVIHFAALKSVGESCGNPLQYYHNNVTGSLNLFQAMKEFGVDTIVFSSSATVYTNSDTMPLTEESPLGANSPYGNTKMMIERALLDVATAEGWRGAILRYFNPVGAHHSGLIGESPNNPTNLFPIIAQVAAGIRRRITVFGKDWPTPDGTGIRDYIHVTDLATAHLAALDYLRRNRGVEYFNVGTGRGLSVLEVISAFSRISGMPTPYEIGGRRDGDYAIAVADPSKANTTLGWKAKYSIEEMVSSAWRWQENLLNTINSTQ